MKKQEFLIGVCVYALVVLAGFSGPLVRQLKKLDWSRPLVAGIESSTGALARGGAMTIGQQALAWDPHHARYSARAVSILTRVQNPIQQARTNHWKSTASFEPGPESATGSSISNPRVLGKKPVSKSGIGNIDKKNPNGEEAPRG